MSKLLQLMNTPNFSLDLAIDLISLGGKPNTTNNNGDSLLHIIVVRGLGTPKIFDAFDKLLTKYHADIHIKNSAGKTPLQHLIDKPFWDVSDAFYLIRYGANPNTKNAQGTPLIHLLALRSENEYDAAYTSLQSLITQFKADINAIDSQNKTALQSLLDKEKWGTAHALLFIEHGADPKTTDSFGQPLIHKLVRYDTPIKPHNLSAIKKLVEHYKLDINATNKQGKTALECLLQKQEGCQLTQALFLISLGAKPDTKTPAGDTLLHLLVAQEPRNREHMKQLVKLYGADIHAKNANNKTPLQLLLDKDILPVEDIFFLIEMGADPNSKDAFGQPLLHRVAHCYGKEDLLYRLVYSYHVDVNSLDADKKTALQTLIDSDGCDVNKIMALLSVGADPRSCANNGRTIGHKLIQFSSFIGERIQKDLKHLVTRYNLSFNIPDHHGKTAFQYALDRRDIEGIGHDSEGIFFLLKQGAEQTTLSSRGNSFLHILIKKHAALNTSEMIKASIILFPAMLLVKNSNGDTPFTSAMRMVKQGMGNLANIIPVVEHAPDFLETANTAFGKSEHALAKSRCIAELNNYFLIAHQSKQKKSYELQGVIRARAFSAFKESIALLEPCDKLQQLQWARTQPIFKDHRSCYFFACMGRTNTAIQIDHMIGEVEAALKGMVARKKTI